MSSSSCEPVGIIWEYDRRELIVDGIVHVLGVGLGLVGAIAMVILTANSIRAADSLSVGIYTISLLTMLGFSAAYNLWPISRTKWVLRRFDHSAIYVMIAGTYTPFMVQMKIDVVSMGLLIGVWLVAIVGITLKLLLPGRLDRLAILLYLLLGWSGVVFYEPIAAALPSLSLWLPRQAASFTRQASSFMCGRTCDFKTRSGMASYWPPHPATIRPFSTV